MIGPTFLRDALASSIADARHRRVEVIAVRRKHRLHAATLAALQDMRQRDAAALREKLRDEYRTGLDAPPDNPLKLQER